MCLHQYQQRSIILDSAADISCVGREFEILFYTGETSTVGGAIPKMASVTYDIMTAAAVVESPITMQQISSL